MKKMLKRTLSLILAVVMVMGLVPMNAVAATIMGSPDSGREETPVIDRSDPIVDLHGSSRPARPEATETPADPSDQPVDPFWTTWTIEFISVDPGTGDFVLEITGGAGAASADFGLTVLPRMKMGSLNVADQVGQVTGSTVGPALKNTLVTRTGLSGDVMWHTDMSVYDPNGDGSGENIILDSNGKARIEGSFNMDVGTLATMLGSATDVNGNPVNPQAIPLVAVLTTQGGGPGKTFAYKTMGGTAVLRVDPDTVTNPPDTIVLAETDDSFTFDVQHTSVSTEDANIMSVKWVGANEDYVTTTGNTGTVTLNVDDLYGSRKTINVTLSGSSADNGFPYLGDVVIEYNSATVPTPRYLTVHVTTMQTPPIEITVIRGGTAVNGAATAPGEMSDPMALVDPSVATDNGLGDGSNGVTDSNSTDEITLTLITDSDYTDVGDLFVDESGEGDYVPSDTCNWVNPGGTLPEIVSAQATADAELGTYTAGYVEITVVTQAMESAVLQFPVIVTVIDADQYQAIFFGNGGAWPVGESSVSSKTVSTYNDALKGQPVGGQYAAADGVGGDPERSGWKFVGWSTDRNAKPTDTGIETDGSKLTYGANPNTPGMYYAVWEQDQVTVTFHKNDGTSTTSQSQGVTGASITDAPSWTRTGYTKAAGWYTEAACTNKVADDSKFPAADADWYAKWEPNDVVITYAKGVNTSAVIKAGGDKQTVKYDQTDAVVRGTGDVFSSTGTGWTFVNWKVNDSKSYAAGDTFDKITGPLTLTAQWTRDTSTVTFKLAGGSISGSTDDIVKTGNTGEAMASGDFPADPTRTGYTFTGWSGGYTSTNRPNYPATKGGNLDVTAQWTRDTSKIKFVLDGGSIGGSTDDIEKTGNTNTELAEADFPANPTRTGYTFAGWSGSYTSDNLPSFPGVKDQVLTITAQWTRDTSTVTFKLAGGSVSGSTDDIVKTGNTGDAMASGDFPANPTRTGYTFTGWSGGYTSSNRPNYPATKGGNLDVTAQWTRDTSKIKFVLDGGSISGSTDDIEKTGNTSEALAVGDFPADPTKAGFTFTGWQDAAGNSYDSDNLPSFPATKNGVLTITAQWGRDGSKVTFKLDGGNIGGATGDIVRSGDTNTQMDAKDFPANPTKTGYTFAGWSDGYTSTNLPTYPATKGDNLVVTALWTRDTSTVTFKLAGGSISGSTSDIVKTGNTGDAMAAGDFPADPTRAGYTFAGWSGGYTSSNRPNYPATKGGNLDVTAQWTRDTSTVTFKLAGGSISGSTSDIVKTGNTGDAMASGDFPANPTRTGYTFTGWSDGYTSTNRPNYPATKGGNLDVTAQWTRDTSKIKFVLDGGSIGGSTDDIEKTGNTSDALVAGDFPADPTRTGYTFTGWSGGYTSANLPNFPAAKDGVLTITAQWTRDTSTVTFKLAGGSVSGSTSDIVKTGNTGDAMASGDFPANPTRTGYTFTGWSDGYTSTNRPNYPATKGGNLDVTAQWTRDTSKIKFVLAGGNIGGSTDDIEKTGNTSDALAVGDFPADPTREGYSFTGWSGGYTSTNLPNFPAAKDGVLTITAQWEQGKSSIEYNWNYPGQTSTTHNGLTGATDTAVPTSHSRTGYTWDGKWYEETTCTTEVTTFVFPSEIGEKVIYYAKWTADPYDVTYHLNNGGGTSATIKLDPNPQTPLYDSEYTIPADADILDGVGTGWTFVKWTTNANGTGTSYNAGDKFTVKGDVDLYAQWTVDVTFDLNAPATGSIDGASIAAPNPEVVAYNGTISNIDGKLTGTAKDYTFAGWYTTDGTEDPDTGTRATDATQFTAPITLYARWTARTYTFTFDANGGDWGQGGDGQPITKQISTGNVGDDINGPGAATWSDPTRTDYDLTGWAYKKDDGTLDTAIDPDDIPTTLSTDCDGKTLYAVWTLKDYEYIFDANGGDWGGDPAVTTQTRTGLHVGDSVAVWTANTGEVNPTRTDYAFKGWSAVQNGTTALTWPQTMPSEPTDGKVTVYAMWVPVYDVTYVNGPAGNQHGTVDTSKNVTDHEAWTYTVLSGPTVIPAGTGESWNGAYFTDAAGKHWMFMGWESSADGKTYQPNQTINVSSDITLTAQWEEYYQVTLGAPVNAETDAALGVAAQATFGTTVRHSDRNTEKSVWVKKGDSVALSSLALKNNASSYIFAKWTQDQTGDAAGTFANNGTQAAGNDTFTPKADTVLTPNYWLKPTLTSIDSFHLNFAPNYAIGATNPKWSTATHKKATNTLPAYTWTANDATLDATAELQIQIDGTWTTLRVGTAAGADVDVVKTGAVYTFQEAYLKTLKVADGQTVATYNIRVQSKTPGTGVTNEADTTLPAKLEIVVTPDPLEKVNIWAEGGTAKTSTANVDDTDRDSAAYHDHTPDPEITATNKLTYTWYVGDEAPTQKAYHEKPATNNAANIADAKTDVAAKSGTEITGVTGPTVDVNLDAYKGKYIYAVVAASVTGYGAVITNAIPVDYDAAILVTKDDSANITGANYKVYLVPQGVTPTVSSGALTGTGVVEAKYVSGNTYKTDDSALTGGVKYNVFVNKVENDFTLYLDTNIDVTTQITTPGAAQTVKFYSVTAVDTALKHATDDSATPKSVGESFGTDNADVPDVVLTTAGAAGGTITVPSGNGILTGQSVTAKTDSAAWIQDYNVDWGKANTAPTDAAPLPYATTGSDANQNKTTAYTAGTTQANITRATWIGARLEQNVYTVTGNIWVNGGSTTAGVVNTGDNVPQLTFGDYVFKADSVTASGSLRGNVIFQNVPKSGAATGSAITGKYDITATPKTSPRSTILKYTQGQTLPTSGTSATNDPIVAAGTELGGTNKNTLNVDVTANLNPAFTIIVEASTYILNVKDDETPTAHSATQDYANTATLNPPATNVSAGNYTTAPWAEDYAYAAGHTYTVTVTNQGNTTLDVALNILKSVADSTDTNNNGYVYGDKTNVTALDASGEDAYNGTTFGDLAKSFTLAPNATKVFTITVPEDMDVNKTASYAMEFTSIEHGETAVYGPSVTYRLTETITPLEVEKVKAVNSSTTGDGKKVWTPEELTISGKVDSAIPSGVRLPSASETNPDVVYDWYAVAHGTQVNKTATDASGKLTLADGSTPAPITPGTKGVDANGLSYTEHDDHKGMDIYLVARGSGTGNVIKAYLTDPPQIVVNYDLDIKVFENDALTASEENYKVYLWDKAAADADGVTAFDITKTQYLIEAESGTNTADGLYTAKGLVPDVTYAIYTNAVGGTTNANWQDSTVTASYTNFQNNQSPEVYYHNVILSNTTVSNQQYNAAITADTTAFLATYTGTAPYDTARTDTLKAPTAKVGTTDVATNNVDKWVQNGTTVDLSYANWSRDYSLTWSGVTTGAKVNTAPAAGTVGGTGTVRVTAADTTVGTALELNLYEFKLWVAGKGTITEGKLTGTGGALSFTSKADDADNGVWNGTNGVKGNISENNSYTFEVPKGSYEASAVVADGVTLLGYRKPHSTTVTPGDTYEADKVEVTVDTDTDADVVLSATGRAMTVADNADTVDPETSAASGTARYTDKATDATVNQTVTLPYGYDAKELTLTVSNTGNENTDVIYQVKMDASGKHASNKITITPADTDIAGTSGIASMNKDDSTTVKVGIATGLAASDTGYTSTLVFSYNADDGDDTKTAKVTYNLKIVVEPAEFTDVSITKASGTPADIGTAQVELGEDLKPFQYETQVNDLFGVTGENALVEGTDYTYLWYATPADKTLTGTWADGVFTPAASANATALTAEADYTLKGATIAAHPGEKIWLVVKAEDGKNVIEAAISDPVTTGFQPVVKVAVDNVTLTKDAGKPADGDYTVTITDGATTWNTKWSDDKGGYVAVDGDDEVSLDATKSYTASASRAKGDTTTVALPSTDTMTLASPAITANYFTVNAVKTKAFEAITGLGEDFGGAAKNEGPVPAFTLGGSALADQTPVLKGQSVSAAIAAGDKWSQDYKLTWYSKLDNNNAGTNAAPTFADAYETTGHTMNAWAGGKQDVNAASATGYANVEVAETLYIGGRLEQNTYTVTGTVKGAPGTVTGVTVEQVNGEGAVVATYAWPTADGKRPSTGVNDGNGNGTLQNNETVTFTVVKGDYTITSTPDGSTVIESVKWESETAVDGNVLTKKTVAALSDTNTKTAYSFEINVVGSSLSLTVNETASSTVVTSGVGDYAHDDNAVVRYFSHIDKLSSDATAPGTVVFPVVLENPGNMDLDVAMDVFYFDTAHKSALSQSGYFSSDANWEGTGAANTPVFSAGASATASQDLTFATTGSGKVVLNLSDVMKTATTVPAGAKYATDATDSSVKAATLTLGTDAWSKDSGAFVFRFKATSTAGTVYAYYVLDLTVEQLPIVEVSTQVNGDATATGMPGMGDKLQAKGYDADPDADQSLDNVKVETSTKPDRTTAKIAKLTDDDVHFAWVSVPATETANSATILSRFTLDANGELTTSTTGYKILAQNAKEYEVQSADLDRDIYLIAYAPNPTTEVLKTNAVDKAISAVLHTKRTVGVQVTLNGLNNVQPTAGNQDPGYVIFLVEQGKTLNATVTKNEDGSLTITTGEGTWATEWSNNLDKEYRAAIDLNTTYEIYAPSFRGGNTYVNTGLTLGKQTTGDPVLKEKVPYYSVEHTTNVAVKNTYDGFASYLPDSTGKADNEVQKALTVAVSDDKGVTTYDKGDVLSAANVPVLEGMNVKVTVDAAKQSNNATANIKKSWSEATELHTMTATGWTTAAGENKDVAYPAGVGDPGAEKYLIQSADIAVNSAKNFSAELAQKLFDVTFVVKDNTPADTDKNGITPKIEKATLVPDDTGKEPNAGSFSLVYTSPSGGDADGAVVTFEKVPAGAFEIKAEGGERTIVDGYTWNATGDDLDHPVDPGKIVTVIGGDAATADPVNKHAGNTIQIQYGSNAVRWMDNFNTKDGTTLPDPTVADGPEFVISSGFRKADTPTSGPFLALKEGYASADGDVLTYKVRVQNTGAVDLVNFVISQPTNPGNLIADLTATTILDADGNPKAGTQDVTQMGFTLAVGETVEFTVSIPEGDDAKAASSALYTSGFVVSSSNEGGIAGGGYNPAYQVKPIVAFEPGSALVIYGNNKFEDTPVDIAKAWDTTAYDPGFTFSVLSEADVKAYLKTETLPGNVYYSGTGDKAMPKWLVPNTTTGEFTFDAALYATDVNVQTKGAADWDDYKNDAAKRVDDEVVLYIKVVDNDTGAAYYTTYTVNVEPGELKIVGGDFAPTDPISGQAVDKGALVYTKVTDQASNDVIGAVTDPEKNTANGNDTASATSGKVFQEVDGESVHTATWSVDPTTYTLGAADYTFTVTYKPDTAAEKWNYQPDTITKSTTAEAPAIGLAFADEVKNFDAVKETLVAAAADGYSKILTEGGLKADGVTPAAPKALDYPEDENAQRDTFRKGERITYLDTEPTYTVKLQKVGDLYVTLEEVTAQTKGFQVKGGLPGTLTYDENGVFTFEVELSAITGKVWAGDHHIEFVAKGYDNAQHTGEPVKTATYVIDLTVDKKPIPKAHVTGLTDPEPYEKPDKTITVTGEQPTDPTKDVELDKWTDKYGNQPIEPPVVTIKPDEEFKKGKDYTTTVVLTPDPNYTFEDETPEGEEPNYTAGSTTPDDDYTLTVTPEKPDAPVPDQNKEVKFEKTVSLPADGVLKFDDKKVDGGTTSSVDPATTGPEVDDARGTITVTKGGKLGKYEINLGAYGNAITGVVVTETNTLPTEGLVWSLDPKVIDRMENVEGTPAGAKTTYVLDLTGIDTNKANAGTYSLVLSATGTNPYNEVVTATYTITIRINNPGGGGGGGSTPCPNQVTFLLGLQGTTSDPTMEMVADRGTVSRVPGVTALEGYKFIGWSQTAPTGDAEKDAKREAVDPKSVTIDRDVTFYAIYQKLYEVPKPPFHEHYVIGYPNGNFGPADDINRASVATIIARAVLPNFVEGADYGNPGGYSDVSGHWAESAIAYCSKYGVFQGYTDGTFQPDQSITRQELALVVARLSGVQSAKDMPFTDVSDAGSWAVDGIYTAYANGWVNGYTDGTFKPLNPIRRDETVKIFNAFLNRGVDAEGLEKLSEYVHSGVASNNQENGTSEYMTWPDVPKDHWAYYEIIEAANDHEFAVDPAVPGGYQVPETWDKCWIDEKWRYHDDLTDGGPTTGLVAAGFRIWSK